MKRRLLPVRRERGVAVITALLLTTLAVSIVASLFWQQQVQVRSLENQRLHLQTKWILRGALDWSTLVLDSMAQSSPYISLDQPWATPLADTRLDQYIERERVQGENFDASLSGGITDACSRYNLRNLADPTTGPDTKQIDIFRNLLRNVNIPDTLAAKVAAYVDAAQPPVATTNPNDGNGGTTATSRISTVSGKPMQLLQVDDLLAIQGFTPELVERLRPFVIVLPQRGTKVNVNTAPPEVLAALVQNMSVSEASALVVRRKQAPWNDYGKFTSQLNGHTMMPSVEADVTSNWFLVSSRIRLDRAALDAEALLQRGAGVGPGNRTHVVWIRQN
ncbi:type II secretion system minor pseudopilin GspK [Massilia forsythiae]|uniref:Type II secretion system protein K n=1 Tax=Massilia forsythiae TaxID=2728020 RepID=A0A7Z2ZRU6_9BURK|nr:type II secretion system minor pseudopilin GspK [Massilia forsythiae]QJD99800.1 type II secretion system minor pseudopilin GspK [Massilia forsythiae]